MKKYFSKNVLFLNTFSYSTYKSTTKLQKTKQKHLAKSLFYDLLLLKVQQFFNLKLYDFTATDILIYKNYKESKKKKIFIIIIYTIYVYTYIYKKICA